jgi:transposase
MRQTGSRMSGEKVKRLTLAVEANRAVSQALGRRIEALEKRGGNA